MWCGVLAMVGKETNYWFPQHLHLYPVRVTTISNLRTSMYIQAFYQNNTQEVYRVNLIPESRGSGVQPHGIPKVRGTRCLHSKNLCKKPWIVECAPLLYFCLLGHMISQVVHQERIPNHNWSCTFWRTLLGQNLSVCRN